MAVVLPTPKKPVMIFTGIFINKRFFVDIKSKGRLRLKRISPSEALLINNTFYLKKFT
jgi:hypothetical protein